MTVFAIRLPKPPSVNAMYLNMRGHGRIISPKYRAWKKDAEWSISGIRLENFVGPVQIEIVIEESPRSDLDNFCKPICDFLVQHKIIVDDKCKYVRKITIEWGDVDGAIVTIKQVEKNDNEKRAV